MKISELLALVGKGESFTITKHGMPVAILTQPPDFEAGNAERAVEAIKGQREKFTQAFSQVDVKELIEEGRR